MNNIFLDTINGKSSSRPPVWFMRQAGRILPSYRKLKESHNFYDMMKDPELSSEVTLLPINDLGVDSAILFSDILVIPDALGLDLIFTKNGPKFTNALNNENFNHLNFDPQKLEYIYTNIKKTVENKNTTPLIGFCGGPLTTFMFMFRGDETQKSFKDAINFFKAYRLYQITDKIDSIFKLDNTIFNHARFSAINLLETNKKLKNLISDFAMGFN